MRLSPFLVVAFLTINNIDPTFASPTRDSQGGVQIAARESLGRPGTSNIRAVTTGCNLATQSEAAKKCLHHGQGDIAWLERCQVGSGSFSDSGRQCGARLAAGGQHIISVTVLEDLPEARVSAVLVGTYLRLSPTQRVVSI